MKNNEISSKLLQRDPQARVKYVERALVQVFENAGWSVELPEKAVKPGIDLIVKGPESSYAVEVKIASEGRGDRLIPAWSQAYLIAKRAAHNLQPLVVIAAPKIPPGVADQLIDFAKNYAPDAALGILDFHGFRIFRGPDLEKLDSERKPQLERLKWNPPKHINLFSDLNQWMFKVLLAPEIPPELLAGPRGQYRNASDLAAAADVSVMSAFRFVEQLKEEGYLEERAPLNLARRKDLMRRWLSSASIPSKEVPVKLILRGDAKKELSRILQNGRKCLGLYAAADALGLGFVQGVPPHIYIPKVDEESIAAIKSLRPVDKNESPDFILRQPIASESVFRGRVHVNNIPVSDVLQIWLDVSYHPARGSEQADLIRREILDSIFLKHHG